MPATTSKHSKKTHIGNHLLHPETQMMNYRFEPSSSEGSVKPPVFLTSTFVFRTAEEGRQLLKAAARSRRCRDRPRVPGGLGSRLR
jgi:methionine-gamma-lyase